ncbi:MAG: DNA-binding protein WhiA [Oscillospiraceae bacterium]|nr:DNA-binding protein WhiA [Oscillospiraceae bacterium]
MKNLFKDKIKNNLINIPFKCHLCSKYFLFGYLFFNKNFLKNNNFFLTNNKNIFDFISSIIKKIFSYTYFISKFNFKSEILYTLSIKEELNKISILNILKIDIDNNHKYCCLSSFYRGVFLACGRISNPELEYYLEFNISNSEKYQLLLETYSHIGIIMKKKKRKEQILFYTKCSEDIEDFLTFLGDTESSLEIMNIKILKNVRNKVNRVVNCETANIDKVLKASEKQIEDILFIDSKKGLNFLTLELRKLAIFRLNNQDISLKDIGEMINPSITRSSVYYKIKKISKIADSLRKTDG